MKKMKKSLGELVKYIVLIVLTTPRLNFSTSWRSNHDDKVSI